MGSKSSKQAKRAAREGSQGNLDERLTPLLNQEKLLRKFDKKTDRIFFFDYDGTLTPIVNNPEEAVPSPRLLNALERLSACPGHKVWIISGREVDFLDKHLGHIPKLGLCAEHGAFARVNMEEAWQDITSEADMKWQSKLLHIFQEYTISIPRSWIETKRKGYTFHYRNADPEIARVKVPECRAAILKAIEDEKYDVGILDGKENIEVRPLMITKGCVLRRMLNLHVAVLSGIHVRGEISWHPMRVNGLVFCAGDDRTDEDMFRALKTFPSWARRFTVSVGPASKPTAAKWHLPGPDDVLATIENMLDRQRQNEIILAAARLMNGRASRQR